MWNYSGDPSESELDEVRFHLQDTDPADQLMSDEELEFLIAQWMPVYSSLTYVASIAAGKLAARFAREVSVSGDGTSVASEQLQAKYEQLSVRLREEHKSRAGVGALVHHGGSVFALDFDPSLRPLSFGKGAMDNPRAGAQDEVNAGPNYSIPGPA